MTKYSESICNTSSTYARLQIIISTSLNAHFRWVSLGLTHGSTLSEPRVSEFIPYILASLSLM